MVVKCERKLEKWKIWYRWTIWARKQDAVQFQGRKKQVFPGGVGEGINEISSDKTVHHQLPAVCEEKQETPRCRNSTSVPWLGRVYNTSKHLFPSDAGHLKDSSWSQAKAIILSFCLCFPEIGSTGIYHTVLRLICWAKSINSLKLDFLIWAFKFHGVHAGLKLFMKLKIKSNS